MIAPYLGKETITFNVGTATVSISEERFKVLLYSMLVEGVNSVWLCADKGLYASEIMPRAFKGKYCSEWRRKSNAEHFWMIEYFRNKSSMPKSLTFNGEDWVNALEEFSYEKLMNILNENLT